MIKIISKSVKDTLKIGRAIAQNLEKGDILCLFGELGSGKTVLVKGIAYGLGIKSDQVISPTFVLLRQYAGSGIPLYHFDFYRLNSAAEIAGLGYEEYFYGEGITVIEWPDRMQHLLPRDYLEISFSILGAKRRRLDFRGTGKRFGGILRKLHEDIRH